MDRDTAVTALQNAVAYLKGKKIIKKENEISLRTGFTKGAVSGYISGNATPSKNFIAKFQEVYNLDLKDYVKEKPVIINDTYGAGVEALIRIEAQNRVMLSYVAEIYAAGATSLSEYKNSP